MKAYGMTFKDWPRCCPGHDTYSCETYNNNRSKRAHTEMTKKLHRKGRRIDKINLKKDVREENIF